jgi:hypothetical protein
VSTGRNPRMWIAIAIVFAVLALTDACRNQHLIGKGL